MPRRQLLTSGGAWSAGPGLRLSPHSDAGRYGCRPWEDVRTSPAMSTPLIVLTDRVPAAIHP
jgi:hypothetical protein